MQPITFRCRQQIARPAEAICAEIANTANWTAFRGYGPLPGIAEAVYEHRTDQLVGSRIRVRNTDGSGHLEEITAWSSGQEVAMTFHSFTPPLSVLATHFTEVWTFQPEQGGTLVTRTFGLYPRHRLASPALWLIAQLLRRAVARQLTELATPG
jgi:hypothetical protein